MVHSDGDGEEKGELMVQHNHTGDLWTTALKTKAGAFCGKPSPTWKSSWSQTESPSSMLNMSTLDIHIHVDRVPGKKAKVGIINGARLLLHNQSNRGR